MGNHVGSRRVFAEFSLQHFAQLVNSERVLPVLWIESADLNHFYFIPNYYLGVVAEQLAPIYGNSCSQDGSNECADSHGIIGT